MDDTFNTLIQRTNQQNKILLGDPWSVLPIKNFKNARECTEVYLGKQNLQGVQKFENFPNIEVLWLNNNQFEKIEGLDSNYKIKHLYLQENKIKTIINGSLKYLKHLQTLVLSKNEIRGLDVNLEFLEQFTQLKQLDLNDNPLTEEPNYRIKLIYTMPWVQLLDQHIITEKERIKARDFFQNQQKNKKKKISKFSDLEKDLFKTAKNIITDNKNKLILEEQQEKQNILNKFTIKLSNTLPKPKIVWEVEDKNNDIQNIVTEWEKNKIKTVFKKLDLDKKRALNKAQLQTLFENLCQDQQMVGKIPDCSLEHFYTQILNGQDSVSWDDFRMYLNKFSWKKQDSNALQQRINEKFQEGQKLQNIGKPNLAFQSIFQAMKLQNTQDYEDKEQFFYLKKTVFEEATKINKLKEQFF